MIGILDVFLCRTKWRKNFTTRFLSRNPKIEMPMILNFDIFFDAKMQLCAPETLVATSELQRWGCEAFALNNIAFTPI